MLRVECQVSVKWGSWSVSVGDFRSGHGGGVALWIRQGVGMVGGDSQMMEPSVPLSRDLSQGGDRA